MNTTLRGGGRAIGIAVACLAIAAGSAQGFYWDTWPGSATTTATTSHSGDITTQTTSETENVYTTDWENPEVTTTHLPEPTTVVTGLIALGLIGAWRRRSRK